MDEYVDLAASLSAGLLAGVFFAFAVAVMPALRNVDDGVFVDVMQRINVSIVNPVFVPVFLSAPALAVWAAVLDGSERMWAAALLGVVTLLISFVGNIPLNNRLDRASLEGAVDAARAEYEKRWVVLNIVRTITGVASLACLVWS